MGVKKYFQRQFQVDMLFLEHDPASDFYLSGLQKNRSSVPLLLLRTVILLGCLAILVSSLVITETMLPIFGHWFIFMTHWGLVVNTVAAGLAVAVSANTYLKGPIDGSLGLPWYVKAYWVMTNVAVPLAFFITVFYWIMLTGLDQDYAMDPVLDVFIHAINSVLMLALLLVGRHPVRLLHFYCCLGFGVVYLLFTVIYYFAGGLSPFGEVWIYPQLDWSKAGEAVGTTAGSAVGLIVVHFIVVGISLARDGVIRKYNRSISINDYD